MPNNETYNIIVYRQNNASKPRIYKRDLTLEQARKHCADPETSSMTAKLACNNNPAIIAKWHAQQKHWFHGFLKN